MFRQFWYKICETDRSLIDKSRGDLGRLAPRKNTAKVPLGFKESFKNPAHSTGAGFLIFRAFQILALHFAA
jgi:hypothetical protein